MESIDDDIRELRNTLTHMSNELTIAFVQLRNLETSVRLAGWSDHDATTITEGDGPNPYL